MKINKYSGSFVKNLKFMYLNACIPTALLPSLSTYQIFKKPNGSLSFSLFTNPRAEVSLSLSLSLPENTNPLFSTLPISTSSSRSFDHSLRVSISSSNDLNLSQHSFYSPFSSLRSKSHTTDFSLLLLDLRN